MKVWHQVKLFFTALKMSSLDDYVNADFLLLVLILMGIKGDYNLLTCFLLFLGLAYKVHTLKLVDLEKNRALELMAAIDLIQRGHLQSLKTKLQEDPKLLDVPYKNENLLYWAFHYQNNDACILILELMRKRNDSIIIQKKPII